MRRGAPSGRKTSFVPGSARSNLTEEGLYKYLLRVRSGEENEPPTKGEGSVLSEERNTGAPETHREPERDGGGATRLFAGRISCVLGVALAAGAIIAALAGGGPNISAGAVGISLGVLGYFLGARRLALLTVVAGTLALFFGLAASQDLIPGL